MMEDGTIELAKLNWQTTEPNLRTIPASALARIDELIDKCEAVVRAERKAREEADAKPEEYRGWTVWHAGPGWVGESFTLRICSDSTARTDRTGYFSSPAAVRAAIDKYETEREAKKPKPYTAKTWPLGAWVRSLEWETTAVLVTASCGGGVTFSNMQCSWAKLASGYQLSTDGGITWRPAYQGSK